MADSPWGKWVGGLTTGVVPAKKRIENEALDAVTNAASGGKLDLTDLPLSQRVGNLAASVDQDLGQLMTGKRFPLTQKVRDAMAQAADNVKGAFGQGIKDQGKAREIIDNIIGELPGARPRMSYSDMKSQYIDKLDEALGNPRNSDSVNKALTDAKAVLVNAMESKLKPEELANLRDIQARQYDVDRLANISGSGSAGAHERVPVRRLSDEYGKQPDAATNDLNQRLIQPLERVAGTAPNQNLSRSLFITAKRIIEGVGSAAAIKSGFGLPVGALYGLSALGQTGRGARILTGQTGLQQAAKEAIESPQTKELTLANLLRAMRDNSSAVGAAVTGK
jgi:hypothetical protein